MDSQPDKLTQVLIDLARTLGTDFSIMTILDHLVDRIVDLLPVTGAGVMLIGAGEELHFVAASNDTVMQIETLQNELHEGPCLQAYRDNTPVSVTDLAVDAQFPRFSPRAVEGGLAAVFTFPLRLDDHRLGALDLYRDTAGALSESDMRTAQVLADVAAAYLFNAQARVESGRKAAHFAHRSLHDPLTGLPNRPLLEELLDRAIARARRSHHPAAVLFVDLDDFKLVNDYYGHHVGDELLCAVATRLTGILRPGDTLARLGGDEFVVLCEDMNNISGAEIVAARISREMRVPFLLSHHDITITASVGVAFSGPGQDIPEALLRNADLAMYQAKRDGGGRHRLHDPLARQAVEDRDALERDLRLAERRDELALVYQPIIDVRTGLLSAVEALLRWDHPVRGQVLPNTVIPSAERTGMIHPLGRWALRAACSDLRTWQRQGLPIPGVSVNVSGHQVMGPSFAEIVREVVGESGIDPAALTLEMTASVFLTDPDRALAVLMDLKNSGVKLALDEFGTGYSSWSNLRQYPVDQVKIDRRFTPQLLTDKVVKMVVGSIIGLSHALDLSVVAVGVETPAEFAEIAGLEADRAQGHHFSTPLDKPALTRYVTSRG